MIKHFFTPYYSPCLPSYMSFPELSTFCMFPFLAVLWHTLWYLTEVVLGAFPKSKIKAALGGDLFNADGLVCWAAGSVLRMGLEKRRMGGKKSKFLFLFLFSGLFSVGSVAITLKTVLHTLVRGVFGSL